MPMNLLRLSALLSLFVVTACGSKGDTGPEGPQGPAGPAGTGGASVSAITPVKVFTGRKAELTVSGNGTSWSASTTVDFGSGITVDKLTVASPTSLVANVMVAGDAALGARDVTVHDSGTESFKGAFHVDAPLDFSLTGGTMAQGSVVFGHLKDLDVSAPFDTTTTGDGFLTPIAYPNLALDVGTGFTTSLSGIALYGLDFTMLIDVGAPTSSTTAVVTSGPPMGDVTVSNLPAAFQVAPRTGTALVSGTPATVTTTQPYASELFALPAAAAGSLYLASVSSTDANASPALYVLPASGKWADSLGATRSNTLAWLPSANDTFSGIFFDSSGSMGSYTVSFAAVPVTTTQAELVTAVSTATAQVAEALPFVMTGGVLASDTYQHVVKFTLATGDVGKKIHAGTFAGDPQTDTVVEILGPGTASFAGPSDDVGYHDDLVSAATTAAGDYYVVVTASSYYDPSQQAYQLYILLE